MLVLISMNDYGIVGNCQEMCPRRERIRREKAKCLHKFEIAEETEKQAYPRADLRKCVKEFSRAAAGQLQSKAMDVRPPAVLRSTLRYLFERVLCCKVDTEPWAVLYDFVFDRLRAIRQDVIVQHVWNHRDSIYVVECAVRFHLYSIFRLCEEPISVFDPHINAIHLQECLKRLLVSYGENDEGLSNERAEMEAYYSLFNCGSHDAIRHTLSLPRSLRNKDVLKMALKLNMALLNGNYVRVFRMISTLPFLFCVAVMTHIPSIRKCTLQVMSHGYNSTNGRFPLHLLQRQLLFHCESDLRDECNHYGIKTDLQSVHFRKQTFATSQPIMPLRQFGFIKEKHQNVNLINVLYGR